MNDNESSHIPHFDWFTSDNLHALSSPDPVWKNQWAGHPDLGKQILEILESVVQSLEGLAPAQNEKLHNILKEWRELWEWSIDWWYCKDAVARIPEAIGRLEKLSPILTRVTHRKEINAYLREATQCYLYGFFQASTTLFRTALEASIKDCAYVSWARYLLSNWWISLTRQSDSIFFRRNRVRWLPAFARRQIV